MFEILKPDVTNVLTVRRPGFFMLRMLRPVWRCPLCDRIDALLPKGRHPGDVNNFSSGSFFAAREINPGVLDAMFYYLIGKFYVHREGGFVGDVP